MASQRVPFVDLQARLRPLRNELIAAYERVLDRGIFVMGPEAAALEEEFAAFCGVKHAVAVSSGTAAIHLALLAADIGPGDEVITVANTFIATVEAISAVGALPVFVDVDPDTYLIDPSQIEAAITLRTRAIIPVHLYGLACDMDAIGKIARRHGLALVEDACQAHGATYRGLPAGAWRWASCFSFYPAKNVGSLGEGGIITTNDDGMAARIRRLRNHGEARRYDHVEPGWNFRLSEVLAASVRVQLPHVDTWNARRREVAAWYGEALRGLPVQLPAQPAERAHVFHLYVIQVDRRDDVRAELEVRGVGTGIHYAVPVYRQPAYESLRIAAGALPVTEAAASRVLSLPMFPEMTRQQVDRVAASLAAALDACAEPVG